MKYLKKFENNVAYEAAESGLILPNVSLIADTNKVEYNPFVPDPYAGHDYVDLGLPSGTKWATMNVGANSVTDYGNYYQYGKGAYDVSVTSGQPMYDGEGDTLELSADTAAQVWGGEWHMPTQAQLQELTANTNFKWSTINNVKGAKYTSKTDSTKYIFLPAEGCWYEGNYQEVQNSGYYWSSNHLITMSDTKTAYRLWFSNSGGGLYHYSRSFASAIRPVVG